MSVIADSADDRADKTDKNVSNSSGVGEANGSAEAASTAGASSTAQVSGESQAGGPAEAGTGAQTGSPAEASGAADHGDAGRSSVLAGVHERLRRLQRLSRRRHIEARSSWGPFGDTTRGQGRVLAALKLSSPLPTRDLAYLLDIRQQSLNELLTKLEAQGLVERRPSESDRRVRIVSLTQAGQNASTGTGRSEYLGVLTDEEAAELSRLLDKVIASLEEELGLDGDEDVEAWLDEARRRMGQERAAGLRRMHEMGFGPDHYRGGAYGDHRGGPEGPRGGHRGGPEGPYGDPRRDQHHDPRRGPHCGPEGSYDDPRRGPHGGPESERDLGPEGPRGWGRGGRRGGYGEDRGRGEWS